MNHDFDAIVIGSGAGGSATAYQLARHGKRVLVLEKGGRLPRDGSTLDVRQVFGEGRFGNKQIWRDGRGEVFTPGEFYNLGGKTKWYGAALLRFMPHEFKADAAHQCLPWPIGYDVLAPWYDEAERLLGVRHFEHEADLRRLIAGITAQGDWRAESLPLGLRPAIISDLREAKHFDGFASVAGHKADAERSLLESVTTTPGCAVKLNYKAIGFSHADGDPATLTGVNCLGGAHFTAPTIILAAGAMSSPRLLQAYFSHTGLEATLPSARQAGAHFKMHVNSALLAFAPRKFRDALRKTAIFFNDAFPHSSVQPLGWLDGEILATQLPGFVPGFVTKALGARAYGFFVTTEDGSTPDNRITEGTDGPVMDYDLARLGPARTEHRAVLRAFKRALLRRGLLSAARHMGPAGTAHALGSLVMGDDPAHSVVDAHGRVHGLRNLYVADGSVLPRSSRVNPALTIYAWGLRLGEHLAPENSA
ncbi:MAG: GMC family oxidoreductase [Gammaproteobacteria bacterium]|nr:GMC family oxidoreductase [Gammaproteobacteria bacterium]